MVLLFGIAGCSSVGKSPGKSAENTFTVPEIVKGELTAEPFVTGNDDSLCTRTSAGYMAEVEKGYYYSFDNILYYADKSNLSKWVPVCNKPDCRHEDDDCNAYIGGEFLLYESRIYFRDSIQKYEPNNKTAIGEVLASMGLDGSDRKIAYKFEGYHTAGQQTARFFILYDQLLAFFSAMQEDGMFAAYAVRVDENGKHTLFTGTREEMPSLNAMTTSIWAGMHGDTAVYCGYLGDASTEWTRIYRPTEDSLEEIGDVSGMDLLGSYLFGDVLRIFVPDDGYYDVDLSTHEKVKVEDARLSGSWGVTLMGNCVLESTLLSRPQEYQTGMYGGHSMEFYDGTGWHPVQLPEELMNLEDSIYLIPEAIASDRIFFILPDFDKGIVRFYQLLLGTGNPEITFCGEIIKQE